ncbi:MAG: macro domain-containing protein [Lachnospiraceae bacterium]|nr:macro domain-containing protein [Lachnospiraceae bacterium]
MSSIKIQKISIVDLDTDVIVNAANSGLWAGGGVCGAIFEAAGYDKLTKTCKKIGHCEIGSAVITPGFDLKAKYIIHAVGPIYSDGKHGEAEMLYNAYKKSLELAVINGCRSIGFPLISAGIFGYPLDEAWELAVQACKNYIAVNHDVDIEIIFAVLSERMRKIGEWHLNRTED